MRFSDETTDKILWRMRMEDSIQKHMHGLLSMEKNLGLRRLDMLRRLGGRFDILIAPKQRYSNSAVRFPGVIQGKPFVHRAYRRFSLGGVRPRGRTGAPVRMITPRFFNLIPS